MWFYGCPRWKPGGSCSFYLFDEWEKREGKEEEAALLAAAERGERWALEVTAYENELNVVGAMECTGAARCIAPNQISCFVLWMLLLRTRRPAAPLSCAEGPNPPEASVDDESWSRDVDAELDGARRHATKMMSCAAATGRRPTTASSCRRPPPSLSGSLCRTRHNDLGGAYTRGAFVTLQLFRARK